MFSSVALRAAWFLALAMPLAACVGDEHWYRAGTSERDRVADVFDCGVQARQSSPYFGNDPYVGFMVQDLQMDCMRAKGYRLVRGNGAEP